MLLEEGGQLSCVARGRRDNSDCLALLEEGGTALTICPVLLEEGGQLCLVLLEEGGTTLTVLCC